MATRKKKMTPEQMREFIHSLRGKYKRKPGDKPFAEEWAEYKREEKELEERKFQRSTATSKKMDLTRLRSKLDRIKRARSAK